MSNTSKGFSSAVWFTGLLLMTAAAPTLAAKAVESGTIKVTPLRGESDKTLLIKVEDAPETRFSWGGFIKLDAIYSDFTKGESLTPNGRDFYVPGATPVGTQDNSQTSLDVIAKETRLFFKTDTDFGDGHKLGAYLEMDFLVNPGAGTANVTNAYNLGLRRAYLTYDNWLIGQDWTTFQDLTALPEGLDFIGPTEGTVFGRQPMVRYSMGDLQLALENPETAVLANGGASAALSNDNVLPDFIARYYLRGDWGQLALAGLVRQLKSQVSPVDDSTIGGGLSFTGKLKTWGADDVRFAFTIGEGLGRYVGINSVQDAVVDAESQLDAIGLSAGYIAYRHEWNPQWRSNLTVSALKADNTSSTGAEVTKLVHSAHANLLYSPKPKFTVGAELMRAQREIESGAKGELYRLQFSAKYSF